MIVNIFKILIALFVMSGYVAIFIFFIRSFKR